MNLLMLLTIGAQLVAKLGLVFSLFFGGAGCQVTNDISLTPDQSVTINIPENGVTLNRDWYDTKFHEGLTVTTFVSRRDGATRSFSSDARYTLLGVSAEKPVTMCVKAAG